MLTFDMSVAQRRARRRGSRMGPAPRRRRGVLLQGSPPFLVRVSQAATAIRSVDFNLAGLPPGGIRGEWSRLESASRISSIDTTLFAPGIARRPGHEVTAAA